MMNEHTTIIYNAIWYNLSGFMLQNPFVMYVSVNDADTAISTAQADISISDKRVIYNTLRFSLFFILL